MINDKPSQMEILSALYLLETSVWTRFILIRRGFPYNKTASSFRSSRLRTRKMYPVLVAKKKESCIRKKQFLCVTFSPGFQFHYYFINLSNVVCTCFGLGLLWVLLWGGKVFITCIDGIYRILKMRYILSLLLGGGNVVGFLFYCYCCRCSCCINAKSVIFEWISLPVLVFFH